MFIDYGDVTVVKGSPSTYWVDFEQVDQDEEATRQEMRSLKSIQQVICQKHKMLIRNIREYKDAHRFPETISNGPLPKVVFKKETTTPSLPTRASFKFCRNASKRARRF